MSGRVPDAENRGRVDNGTPAVKADDHPVKSELEWKNGSAEYTTSSVPSWATFATWAPVRASRPWVQRTAFGSPVEPDVKISSRRSSSVTAAGEAGPPEPTSDGYSGASTISTRSGGTG